MAMEETGAGGGGGGEGMGLIGLIAILALFNGGLGGFGGNNRGGCCACADEFRYDDIQTQMAQGFNNVTAQNNFDTLDTRIVNLAAEQAACCCNTQTAILDAKYANALLAKDAELAAQACCCETNRNIDAVRTQMATDTCAIITNQQQLATAAELREVYAKLEERNLALSEARIVNAITANLQPPRPIPAYAAMNPYSTYTPLVNVAAQGACGVAF